MTELNLVKAHCKSFSKKRKLQEVESCSDRFQSCIPIGILINLLEEYTILSENEGNGVLDYKLYKNIEVASTEQTNLIPDLLAPGSAANRLKDGQKNKYIGGEIILLVEATTWRIIPDERMIGQCL